MILIKSDEDIKTMKEAGSLASSILDDALKMVIPRRRVSEIDNKIDESIKKAGAYPWFKEVNGYKYASCISVNDVWLHGIPNDYEIKDFDVVKIDLGVKYKNRYVDTCWTVVANEDNPRKDDIRSSFEHSDPKVKDFLVTGAKVLDNAINMAKVGGHIGDISSEIQTCVESMGYAVIREFTGHGVGLGPHEAPAIPCFGVRGAGPVIKPNMVFAIEVMYTMGKSDIKKAKDQWSTLTKDGCISAMFEHTVAISKSGPSILTL